MKMIQLTFNRGIKEILKRFLIVIFKSDIFNFDRGGEARSLLGRTGND